MVRYKFKMPNLLEIGIIFALILAAAFGWFAINMTNAMAEQGNLAGAVSAWSFIQTVYLWLILLALLLNAAILEGIREKL